MVKRGVRLIDKLKRWCVNSDCTIESRLIGVLEPRYMWFEATDMCNSKCKYCNIHKKKPTSNPLSPEELYGILSDSLFRKVKYIINSGGEMTCRSDFIDILLAEHKALPNAGLNISTNGLLPDRVISAAEEACKLGIKLNIGISLDGIGKDHDRIRGVKGNFDKVVYLLDKLKGLPVEICLGATLTGEDIKANMEAKEFVESRGLEWIFHWYNVSSFYENKTSKNIAGIKKGVATIKPTLYTQMWLDSLDGKKPKFKCYALNTFFVLKCNGDVVPCLSKWNDVAGNVRNSKPKEIWYGKKANEVRQKVKDCEGCLNGWGYQWSLWSDYINNGIPYMVYKLKKR